MAISEWSVIYGEQPSATKWNLIGSNFDYIDNVLPPIGSVIYYWGDSSSVPGFYLVCNGQTVSDGDSALNGLTLPNIISKFVRGITGNVRTTPANGGSDTYNLAHTHTGPSHTHSYAHTHKIYTDGLEASFSGAGGVQKEGTGASGHYSVTAVEKTTYGQNTSTSGASGTGNTGSGGSASQSIIPAYIGLVPIMRYK